MNDTDKFHIVWLELGHRNDLTRAACLRHVSYFKAAQKQYPDSTFGFSIGGYDEDKRELHEIPKVRRYMRRFTEKAGFVGAECLYMPDNVDSLDAAKLRLSDGSIIELAATSVNLVTIVAGNEIDGLETTVDIPPLH